MLPATEECCKESLLPITQLSWRMHHITMPLCRSSKQKVTVKKEAEEFSAELVFHLLFVFPASFKFEPHVFINKSEKNMLENFKEDFLPS